MGAAEFASKSQSQRASTKQDFLDLLSRRDGRTDPQLSLLGYQLYLGRETWEWPTRGAAGGGLALSGSFQLLS